MKKEIRRNFGFAAGRLGAFLLWTAAVCLVDVEKIGPRETAVGFAAINRLAHELTGVHMSLYAVTDWLGLVPLAFAAGFALLGLSQWIGRKHLLRVDRSLLYLGGFYIAVAAAYLFFETVIVNYRPVLIDGRLEASYPSSTTVLTLCVMPTAILQLNARIASRRLKRSAAAAIAVFSAFMVIGRVVSGVHWLTDIVGGVLLSGGLVTLYAAVSSLPGGCPADAQAAACLP